ncbi:MAG: plasmid mobilization relaxosome protein MobC, partial [Oscillospiraceae bacterium]|nr:plasmid mobilization relaxosome protein MobC [Oscillospiraceae bacterium]
DASGMKPCSLVRWMVLHGEVKIYDTEIVNDLLIQFNSIGRLLNQIAKVVNTSGSVFQKDMEDVLSLMKRFRGVFKNYLKQYDPEDII